VTLTAPDLFTLVPRYAKAGEGLSENEILDFGGIARFVSLVRGPNIAFGFAEASGIGEFLGWRTCVSHERFPHVISRVFGVFLFHTTLLSPDERPLLTAVCEIAYPLLTPHSVRSTRSCRRARGR
jgi:hypothetical protein